LGIEISEKRQRIVFLICGIFTLILAIGSIFIMATLSFFYDFILPLFMIVLIVSCPTSLALLLMSYTRRRTPEIQTKLEFIKTQYKAFRLKDTSKTYVCMVCKQDIEINQDVNNCPQCHSYYHQEHLFQWLQINTTCPVCGFDYYKNAIKSRKKKK
jgi:hypothetical protein